MLMRAPGGSLKVPANAASLPPTPPLPTPRRSVFLNYFKMFKVPVLVALHVADTAEELEGLTDAEVIAEGMAGTGGGGGGRDVAAA